MRQTTRWIAALGLVATAWLASAQETPAPAPAPRPANPAADPAPTPTPVAPPAEIRELQIIEVPEVRSTQDAPAPPDAPVGRREIRIVDGDSAIWMDEEGNVMELGEVMGRALEFNPELRAIRAEIHALMARLEQLEMKTATDVVRKKEEPKVLIDKQKDLKAKHVDTPDLRQIEAELAAREMELDYIIGVRGDRPFGGQVRVLGDIPVLAHMGMRMGGSRPGMEDAPESIRQALNREKINVDFQDMELENVVSLMGKKYNLNVVLDTAVRGVKVTLNIQDVTYGQMLLALAEANGLAFIVRDYGIFVTTRDRAISIHGPSIPEGVPYSPHAAAAPTPKPAPAAFGMRQERVFKDGEHVFEPRKRDQDQSTKVLDYVEGKQDTKPAPAPTPKPHN
jgi:hypothetical protein